MGATIQLIGDPVAHSLSPVFQNAALTELGLPLRYEAVQVGRDDLQGHLDGLRTSEVLGANITVPHKVAATGSMDVLERESSVTGAVNTVVVRDGTLKGANTDVAGFLAALAEARPDGLARRSALVLGSGGAARAVVWALGSKGLVDELVLRCRDGEKGQRVFNMLREGLSRSGGAMPGCSVALDDDALSGPMRSRLGLVVNATPLGMGGLTDISPLEDLEGLAADTLVFDLTYGPAPSRLVREAAERGLQVADGRRMLLWQGAESFRLWTGEEPPVSCMAEALEAALGDSKGRETRSA